MACLFLAEMYFAKNKFASLNSAHLLISLQMNAKRGNSLQILPVACCVYHEGVNTNYEPFLLLLLGNQELVLKEFILSETKIKIK